MHNRQPVRRCSARSTDPRNFGRHHAGPSTKVRNSKPHGRTSRADSQQHEPHSPDPIVDEPRLERHCSWLDMKEHELGPSHTHLHRGCVQARASRLPAIRGLTRARGVVVKSTRRWKRTRPAIVHSEHASIEFCSTGVRSDREGARPCAQRTLFPACRESSGGGRNRAYPCRQPSGGGRNRAYPCRESSGGGRNRTYPCRESSGGGRNRAYPCRQPSGGGRNRAYPCRHPTHLGQVRLHPVLHPVHGGGIPFSPNPVPIRAVPSLLHSLPDSGSSRRNLLQRRPLSSSERQVRLRPCRRSTHQCRPPIRSPRTP